MCRFPTYYREGLQVGTRIYEDLARLLRAQSLAELGHLGADLLYDVQGASLDALEALYELEKGIKLVQGIDQRANQSTYSAELVSLDKRSVAETQGLDREADERLIRMSTFHRERTMTLYLLCERRNLQEFV